MFYAAKVLDTRPDGLKLPEGQTEKEKRGRSLFYIILSAQKRPQGNKRQISAQRKMSYKQKKKSSDKLNVSSLLFLVRRKGLEPPTF